MWHWEKDLITDLHSSHEFYGRYDRIFDYALKIHYLADYHRYTDDVFFTWNGTLPSREKLLKDLNAEHPLVKLVHEIGINMSFLTFSFKIIRALY